MTNGKRTRHPDKNLETIIQMAEARGWRVKPTKRGYFKMYCPCADKHLKMVAKTPSGSNYGKNLLGWLQRLDCWKEDS